ASRDVNLLSIASSEINFSSGLFGGGHLPASNDPEWSLDQVKVKEAWQQFFPSASPANPPGSGIIIGHPDTGYTKNPETLPNIHIEKGFNFLEDGLAEDRLIGGLLRFPGHGTGTSSVIVSPVKAQSPETQPGVSGVAPGAKIIPLRVSTSVVLLADMGNLSRAIEYAADNGAHIISISMGGLFSSRLRRAVKYAQKKGVIILAAAGNYVGFVVWPAAFDEVIAVAASNADRETWAFSSSGSKVDVSAPGESVWCAETKPPSSYSVTRSSGTSFSVATTAGVAALWLAYHGRDKLINRYGEETLTFVFNDILRRSCDPFANGSVPNGFGAGIVNAQKVLATPLPDSFSVPVEALNNFVLLDMGTLETFSHLLGEDIDSPSLTSKLSS
ncbi:MAG: peptidase S8 and S53 subtilisin kexin sedolisin, partial [bacterium]